MSIKLRWAALLVLLLLASIAAADGIAMPRATSALYEDTANSPSPHRARGGQAVPLEVLPEPGSAGLEWQNSPGDPTTPGQIDLPPPPAQFALWLHKLRWWALGVVVVALTVWARGQGRPSALLAVIGLFVLGLSLVLGKPPVPPAAVAEQVVGGLLHNIYRAFDYREEGEIHDALERSVAGGLLTGIYAGIGQSLELADPGGARARVRFVELQELGVFPANGRGFHADVTWDVTGTATHAGQVYTLDKRYQAEMDIRIVDDRWKLAGMGVLQERRPWRAIEASERE